MNKMSSALGAAGAMLQQCCSCAATGSVPCVVQHSLSPLKARGASGNNNHREKREWEVGNDRRNVQWLSPASDETTSIRKRIFHNGDQAKGSTAGRLEPSTGLRRLGAAACRQRCCGVDVVRGCAGRGSVRLALWLGLCGCVDCVSSSSRSAMTFRATAHAALESRTRVLMSISSWRRSQELTLVTPTQRP